jgi:hypothetical protein
MVWHNYYTVARSLTQISGATQLQPAYYWSSKEHVSNAAWLFGFIDGSASTSYKGDATYVRAVRAF